MSSVCFTLVWILLHTVTVWFFWLIFILTTDCTCGRICFSPCSQSPFVWIACTFAENCRQVSNFWCTLKHTICFQVAFLNFFSIFFYFLLSLENCWYKFLYQASSVKRESMQKSTKIVNSWQGSKHQNRSSFA